MIGRSPPRQPVDTTRVPTEPAAPPTSRGKDRLLRELTTEFELPMGQTERVTAACHHLRELAGAPEGLPSAAALMLADLLQKRAGPLAKALYPFLEDLALKAVDPWPLLERMVVAADGSLALRALDLCLRLAESGALAVNGPVVDGLAARAAAEGSSLRNPEALSRIAAVLSHLPSPIGRGPIAHLYEEDASWDVRRLAARILDLEGKPVDARRAGRILGAEAHRFLRPYLEYSGAGHVDLLELCAAPGRGAGCLAALRRAEAAVGEQVLRRAIAALGWPRLRLDLEVRPLAMVRMSGSMPVVLRPPEASLVEASPLAQRAAAMTLFIAQGGSDGSRPAAGDGREEIDQFRGLNLLHAELLEELLDIAPLDHTKVERILARMDRAVEGFCRLFRQHADECQVLPVVYGELRQRILAGLEQERDRRYLSGELFHLVQMFEEPVNLGAVTTLHGLKRLLHQRGLQLGFRLLHGAQAPSRTVDLLVASATGTTTALRKIGYVDFEPDPMSPGGESCLPYPVSVAVEAFAHQLIHGQTSFPEVKIFCYGNEIHYYIAFQNHPLFLRVNLAPPAQGGMLDLEFYGVSKYELSQHPNTCLDALVRFFQAMEFDVRAEATRVQARYDKERASCFGDLCDRLERLFTLVPYLMDLDWTIGDLDLDEEARGRVAEAWSRLLEHWRVLPLDRILSSDRRGIVAGVDIRGARPVERLWDGRSPYEDRFSAAVAPEALAPFFREVASLALEEIDSSVDEGRLAFNQRDMERWILRPLRAAVARGELEAVATGYRRRPEDTFRREAAAVIFARMLESADTVQPAAELGALARPLDRLLPFETTGRVNGHEVQAAPLALRGQTAFLHVLRDRDGIIRLALFVEDSALWSRREAPNGPWSLNGSTDRRHLATLLRRDGYVTAAEEPGGGVDRAAAARLIASFRRPAPGRLADPLAADGPIDGLKAAPGRAVGLAALGVGSRRPEDLEGRILVARSVCPRDSAYLYRSRAVISTGGGILSHAGLLASQFGRPALVVEGDWREEPGGAVLVLGSRSFHEEISNIDGFRVSVLRERRDVPRPLREGDLVVVDADEGYLQILGQEPDARRLHDEVARLREASRLAEVSTDPLQRLGFRGQQMRAIHQIRKLLARMADPVLARHAIRELLLGEPPPAAGRVELLSVLLQNPRASCAATAFLRRIGEGLAGRLASSRSRALERIPVSSSLYEILGLRLELLRVGRAVRELAGVLHGLDLGAFPQGDDDLRHVESLARARLRALRAVLLGRLATTGPGEAGVRQVLRQVRWLDQALGEPSGATGPVARLGAGVRRRDQEVRMRLHARRILLPEDGGLELAPLSGWKAANLAEMVSLLGPQYVPRWFVVTHRAFDETLGMPLPPGDGRPASFPLGEAIREILAHPGLSDEQRSRRIGLLWEQAVLPPGLADEVKEAYRRLSAEPRAEAPGHSGEVFVSVRSSTLEEDAEATARAGEFDTFLFVRGEEEILRHLRRAWAGLWTERAIHNRAVLGLSPEGKAGGIIVQRIVWARAAGVMTTVNAADGLATEMVINAGLGMGEGIVSGAVAADHIVVVKEELEQDPVSFRYRIADKPEQIVFDRQAGQGTVRVETLYHQRFRPVLNYREICDLARIAARLEDYHGYPLDIEFAVESSRPWLLQARPLAACLALVREVRERFPLGTAPAAAVATGGK